LTYTAPDAIFIFESGLSKNWLTEPQKRWGLKEKVLAINTAQTVHRQNEPIIHSLYLIQI
jgi:hypothetical protein